MLSYYTMQAGKLVLSGDTILVYHKVACIVLTPLADGDTGIMTNGYILGPWTDCVRLVKLPRQEKITMEYLEGEVIPRSILML